MLVPKSKTTERGMDGKSNGYPHSLTAPLHGKGRKAIGDDDLPFLGRLILPTVAVSCPRCVVVSVVPRSLVFRGCDGDAFCLKRTKTRDTIRCD